jgi:hypothetical protein
VIVTLTFAISWLPIHILELMKCSNSHLLDYLIKSYPKCLYTVRALTHALAYFNSCLNPYLYALLNRNFCFDLIDIIPSCFNCGQQTYLFNTEPSHVHTRSVSLPDRDRLPTVHTYANVDDDDDNDEKIERNNLKQSRTRNVDASCQVELLRLTTM